MRNLEDVKARVRSLLGDPDGQWITDDYAVPLINQIYEQQLSFLEQTGSAYLTKSVPCPGIDAGISDLTELQEDGPLKDLVDPLQMWWKIAGAPVIQYMPVKEFEVLLDAEQAYPQGAWWPAGGMAYKWESYILSITPQNFNVDLLVRGEFDPPALVKDSDLIQVHPHLCHSLAYGTAALMAAERGNPGWQQAYGPQATATLDEIAGQLTRSTNGLTRRSQRTSSRRGNFSNR